MISSVAAVVAAVVVPTFWERGSLIATAVTPIIVAIVSELLRKPTQVVTSVAPKVVPPKVVRRTRDGTAVHTQETASVGGRERARRRDVGAEQAAYVPPGGVSDHDPYGLRAAQRPRRRFPLRIAVGTGLIAAVIGAGVVTASELTVFGHSIGHSGRETSLFGGKAKPHGSKATPTPTPTATAGRTATPTPTPSTSATPTTTPSATATATPGASPTPSPTPTPPPAATATPTP
jgi:hypothetical protein